MTNQQQLQKLQHDLIRANETVSFNNRRLTLIKRRMADVMRKDQEPLAQVWADLLDAEADGIEIQDKVNEGIQALNRFSAEHCIEEKE